MALPSTRRRPRAVCRPNQPDARKIWFTALGCPASDLQLAHGFDQVSQLLEATATGLGPAIVQRSLVVDYIDNGRLRIAWDAEVINSRGYYLA